MDADLQDSPDEIPELFQLIKTTTTILFQVGKKSVMMLILQKIYPQNCSIGPHEKFQG